jgi:hypothetical protein
MPTCQSHSGVNLAVAFQAMLEHFGLEHRILTFNADNASNNNTQAIELVNMENSFSEDNRICCFNHTLQLSARALLKPFNKSISVANELEEHAHHTTADENLAVDDDDDDDFLRLDDADDAASDSDVNDNVDEELEGDEDLDTEEEERLFDETSVVRDVIAKV